MIIVKRRREVNTLIENAIVGLLAMFIAVPVLADTAQEELEYFLQHGKWHVDNMTDKSKLPPYVPHRYRNSLPQFEGFIARHSWTTNQFIEGLICAITNNVTDEKWADRDKQRIAGIAVWKLSEIDIPAVTNFFRQYNERDDTSKLKGITIPAMFHRTNLEPEVMAYLRSLCVRTNVYRNVGFDVVYDMFETLKTMSDELKPAATNRVASFIYFSVWNTTQDIAWQDKELAKFIPAYSNSVQRLSAMRRVAATTENWRTRAIVQKEVDRLSSLPTNQLNNISWIAEDVTGGK